MKQDKTFLIIGSTGMLGQALMREIASNDYNAIGVARKNAHYNLDATAEHVLETIFCEVQPDIVINTAAVVDLLQCEKNGGAAYRINAYLVQRLAYLSRIYCASFVHISTDHFYTNDNTLKHSETYPVQLLNEYARTKYAGEQFALSYEKSIVVRTNIVGFRGNPQKQTFVEWALSTLKHKEKMVVFDDFYTSSIDVYQFSKLLLELISKHVTGVYNLASSEVVSKKKFIECLAQQFGYSLENVSAGSVEQLTGIIRGNSLGLDCNKAETTLNKTMPTLDEVINSLYIEGRGVDESEL